MDRGALFPACATRKAKPKGTCRSLRRPGASSGSASSRAPWSRRWPCRPTPPTTAATSTPWSTFRPRRGTRCVRWCRSGRSAGRSPCTPKRTASCRGWPSAPMHRSAPPRSTWKGPRSVAPSLQASLHVEAKKLDARALAPASSPPSTDLALSGDVSITTKPSGAITTQVALDVAAGKLGTTRLPSAVVTGEVTVGPAPGGSGGGSARAIAATAKVAIHEPGAPHGGHAAGSRRRRARSCSLFRPR